MIVESELESENPDMAAQSAPDPEAHVPLVGGHELMRINLGPLEKKIARI
jgi:hypothetical protein